MAMRTMMLAGVTLNMALLADVIHAQQSQTVQLPTFHMFGVSTSVLVPDRGAAYMGGVNSSASGSSMFGPFGRASGQMTDAGGVGFGVFVHDFAAMDRKLLSAAPAKKSGDTESQLLSPAERKTLRQGEVASVRDIRRNQAAAASLLEDEVATHLAKARELEAHGKLGVARIHYQMAHRRATGTMKDEIATHLARQSSSTGAPRR